MLRYLYHCFNSSTRNLLGLLNNNANESLENFPAENEQILLINSFVSWDNPEKNEFLYRIVAFSYEYCMLTTKKDSLLNNKVFKGMRFILDTNIIFRMAGINTDERRFVTNSFIQKCREVGIELCYTNETYSELLRVINNQIKFIQHITQGSAPVDYMVLQSFGYYNGINDFYEIYYKWCTEPQNKYNDYDSFKRYIMNMISPSITDLTFIEIPNYFFKKDNSFEEKCNSLRKFKQQRRAFRPTSNESIQTDINNITYTASLRKSNGNHNLWDIREFIVSADQLLMNWAREFYPGVPIVVIPSVWLSIILRFSGRSSDDYRAFCLFWGMRQRRTEDDEIKVNPATLLAILATKTISKNVKEMVIHEIACNADQYSFSSPEDYEASVSKAFDKVFAEHKSTIEAELAKLKRDAEEEKQNSKVVFEQEKALYASNMQDELIGKMAIKKSQCKVIFWKRNSWIKWTIVVLFSLLAITGVYGFLYKVKVICDIIIPLLPTSFKTFEAQWGFIQWVLPIGCFVVSSCIFKMLNYLASDQRKSNLQERYLQKLKHESKEALNA